MVGAVVLGCLGSLWCRRLGCDARVGAKVFARCRDACAICARDWESTAWKDCADSYDHGCRWVVMATGRRGGHSLGAIIVSVVSVIVGCGDRFGSGCWALVIGAVLWESKSDRATSRISMGCAEACSGGRPDSREGNKAGKECGGLHYGSGVLKEWSIR